MKKSKRDEWKTVDAKDDKIYLSVKKAYLKAIEEKQDTFHAGRFYFVTRFAKYWIDELELIRTNLGLKVLEKGKMINSMKGIMAHCNQCNCEWMIRSITKPIKCPHCQSREWNR